MGPHAGKVSKMLGTGCHCWLVQQCGSTVGQANRGTRQLSCVGLLVAAATISHALVCGTPPTHAARPLGDRRPAIANACPAAGRFLVEQPPPRRGRQPLAGPAGSDPHRSAGGPRPKAQSQRSKRPPANGLANGGGTLRFGRLAAGGGRLPRSAVGRPTAAPPRHGVRPGGAATAGSVATQVLPVASPWRGKTFPRRATCWSNWGDKTASKLPAWNACRTISGRPPICRPFRWRSG